MSTFFGFNIARSGLFASQRALNVTSHNIANANTPGYTRQRLEQQASRPMILPNGKGMLGTGVDTIHIRNIRDQFLDLKFRSENQAFGEWDTRADILQNIEAIMNEPSTSGIRTVMDQFFSSLQELSTKPENLTVRALVRERGIALAKTINQMGYQLEKMQSDLDFSVSTTVGEINGYAAQIADLNKQIYNYELDGNNANDLRDQRNLLLDKLSQLINIDAFEDNQGRMHVLVSGKSLVSHYRYSELGTVPRTEKKNNSDLGGLSDVVWKDGSTFTIQGGKLKGLLDARDNAEGGTKGVPYYMEQLNLFAKTFAAHVNMAHRSGYGLDGSTGNDFFHMGENQFHDISTHFAGKSENEIQELIKSIEKGGSSSLAALGIATSLAYENLSVVKMDGKYFITPKVTATTLKISDKIDQDLNKIAASSTYAGLPGDGSNALNINLLKNNTGMFDWGKPEDFMKSLISNLGVDTQQAIRFANNQQVLLDQVEYKRQSISGVSLDEEMADMVKFQHAYNANARMITTIDEMIDVIVNRMGLVGR
ncbi:flagellar hook-associated protein 1 FlgK [Geosporobacter subterraneus DSM 17957]|uniref:Flagellar hook-associated protein 1 n=1 Tax=Geosporobacter subterraneus DSM 17957 TaxID=1121919 RepID=A0A1M6CMM9_9FIRM|nr:flagellar hook-associated protein FlgK [Geosporobacter subterraneus]SHI61958.1 flagellar hook-associated protein 1 FlgK [Geosporobacter subterraneus DSM 17957]